MALRVSVLCSFLLPSSVWGAVVPYVFTHSSAKGRLECCQLLVTKSKVSVNICVKVFV